MICGGCNCGNCHLTILPTGDVYACHRVQNSRVGSVLQDRLADLWVSKMEAYRDYDRFRKCAGCELKAWRRGCPAVASGARGDFYDIDPQCWKEINNITGKRLMEENKDEAYTGTGDAHSYAC